MPSDLPSNGTLTSDLAAESMRGHAECIQTRVYLHILSKGIHGCICDEVERDLGLTHQCASARVHALASLGLIERSGELRKTRSSRRAFVYVATNPTTTQL